MTALPQKRLTKGQRYSETYSTSHHRPNVPANYYWHVSEANWSVGHKRDSYFNMSFSITTEKREDEKRKEHKDLKGDSKFSLMF